MRCWRASGSDRPRVPRPGDRSRRWRRSLLGGVLLLALGFAAGRLWPEAPTAAQDQPPPRPVRPPAAVPPADGKLRVIAFGAHPADCERKAGGVAAKRAAPGPHVKVGSAAH